MELLNISNIILRQNKSINRYFYSRHFVHQLPTYHFTCNYFPIIKIFLLWVQPHNNSFWSKIVVRFFSLVNLLPFTSTHPPPFPLPPSPHPAVLLNRVWIGNHRWYRSSSVGDIQWMRLEETEPDWTDRNEILLTYLLQFLSILWVSELINIYTGLVSLGTYIFVTVPLYFESVN